MPAAIKKSSVEFVRPEVEAFLDRWCRIRAALEGEEAVKALGDKVLPRPNSADRSAENLARYDAYLGRSVWYNVSGRTLAGLTGFVFTKDPVVELPAELKPMTENVDGSGVTLEQQAKAALRLVLGFGRGGLLVDYPVTDNPTTRQDLLNGYIAPTIVLYEPETVTNWRISYVGAKAFIDMIVLKETFTSINPEDEFELCVDTQYRVLTRGVEGVLGRIFRKMKDADEFLPVKELEYAPKDKSGTPLKEIPFIFLGAVNNDSSIDTPPMMDLVDLNIAHFRNSADYEEASFIVGQPTPWVAGLSEQWVKNVLKGTLHLGSRAVIPLPEGGSAGLLQASPNTLPMEAMVHKEAQMVALGAKLVEQREVQQTATEAGLNHTSEVSTLTAAANNVFLAYRQALTFCGQFIGSGDAKIEFDLSEPLSREVITPEQASAIMALWMGEAIDFEEARFLLKKAGWAWKDDKKVQAANEAAGMAGTKPTPEPNVPAE